MRGNLFWRRNAEPIFAPPVEPKPLRAPCKRRPRREIAGLFQCGTIGFFLGVPELDDLPLSRLWPATALAIAARACETNNDHRGAFTREVPAAMAFHVGAVFPRERAKNAAPLTGLRR